MRLSSAQIDAELRMAQEALYRRDVAAANSRIASILRSNPDSAAAHFGKGMVLVVQGRHAEALPSLLQALRLDPANVETLSWTTLTCLNLHDGAQAEKIARRLIRIQPENGRAHFLLSNALCLQGRLEDGLESIDRALIVAPGEPDFIVGKAQILGRLGWSSQAIEWYRKAVGLRPGPELTFEFADALMTEGQVRQAVQILEQVVSLIPTEATPHELMAQAYTEAQNFSTAAVHWASAEATTYDRPGLLMKRATADMNAGRIEVAETLLREAIEQYPSTAPFYQALTSIVKVTRTDEPLVEEMERLISEAWIEPAAEQALSYALGKAYNDLGEFGKAMQRYDRANLIAFQNSPVCARFDPAAWRAYTDLQIEFFTKDRIKTLASLGLESDLPLFVLGMIRSGTTLTEQVLSRHSKIEAGGEKTFWPDHRGEVLNVQSRTFDTAAANRLGAEFLHTLEAHAPGSEYVTEKNPSNITLAGLIHCVYPNAKLVHIVRHPVDNLLSIWMTPMRTSLPFVHNRDNLVSAYKDYARLADHLAAVLPETRFHTLTYEQLTSSPESTVADLLTYLGLDPEPECLHPERNPRTVRTPSLYQVRQPINTASQAKWTQYAPWLGAFDTLP